MSLIIDEHRAYLADEPRVAAFRAALGTVIRPGDVVLDLGAGTGILGLLACGAGAARVYAVEHGSMIAVAREICAANGLGDRMTFIKEWSTHLRLPEPVDVIVTDQIGRFGFDAGLLEYLPDARARLLKPGGRTVPSRLDLEVAPVSCAEDWTRVAFWDGRPAGFDFSPAARRARHTVYPVALTGSALLGTPQALASIDLSEAPAALHESATIPIEHAGTLHGVAGWFSATLAPGVTMTNAPTAPDRIARRQAFFPIDRPVAVQAHDQVRMVFDIRPVDMVVSWRVFIDRPDAAATRPVAAFRQSTFAGMLLPREDIARTAPDSRPRLSSAGEARRSVLELCDGCRTLAEIEAEVFRRHADLLRSPERAAVFVAEVVTRYAN